MASEAVMSERNKDWHTDALIVNAAVSSAIASAYGKERGGFRRFLSQFRDRASVQEPMMATDGLRDMRGVELDDDWKEF